MLLILQFVACIEASICNVCSTTLGRRFGSHHVMVVGIILVKLLVDDCEQPPRTLISGDSRLGKLSTSLSSCNVKCKLEYHEGAKHHKPTDEPTTRHHKTFIGTIHRVTSCFLLMTFHNQISVQLPISMELDEACPYWIVMLSECTSSV
jgi:hypothetical protein